MKTFTFEHTTVDRVIDGDTIEVTVDLGFQIKYEFTIRFNGFDAPETRKLKGVTNAEIAHGKEAEAWLKHRIEGKKVKLITKKYEGDQEKYGRYLALVYIDGESVIDEMIKLGFHKREEY